MITLTNEVLRGYGLGGPKGCIIDLTIPELMAAAIDTGLIWSAPGSAQHEAVRDIASGRVPEPEGMPEWASNAVAWYRQHPGDAEAGR